MMKLFPLWETILIARKEDIKIANRRNFNKPNLFSCQHPLAALWFLLKCHTAEMPSKGHSEELQQTVRTILQLIFHVTDFSR